jgi:hypothetical protein
VGELTNRCVPRAVQRSGGTPKIGFRTAKIGLPEHKIAESGDFAGHKVQVL